MTDTIWDNDAPIGRRSSPRATNEASVSGVSWNGPTEFVVKKEDAGVFRWVMVSGDARHLQLAQSASLFPSIQECEREIKKLDPEAHVSIEG